MEGKRTGRAMHVPAPGTAIAAREGPHERVAIMNTTPRYPPAPGDIEAREASEIFCVVCAARTRRTAEGGLHCAIGGHVPPQLAHEMADAVAVVAPPQTPTREPALASFLSCPNCTTELQRYRTDERAVCVICGLQLALPDAAELDDFRARHGDRRAAA